MLNKRSKEERVEFAPKTTIWRDVEDNHNSSDSNGADNHVPPPSLDGQVASVIKQRKSNKSNGSDELAAEIFKKGPERLSIKMHQLIVRIWEQKELPEEWMRLKGDRLECSNIRVITVSPQCRLQHPAPRLISRRPGGVAGDLWVVSYRVPDFTNDLRCWVHYNSCYFS